MTQAPRAPRLPDFVGIGAQRSGTSWIYACVAEHPEICAPEKEIGFFSIPDRWARGLGWYADQFRACAASSVVGEYSTSYLYSPEAATRIAHCCPGARLLVSLRNPVDRAYSGFVNGLMSGELAAGTDFEHALDIEPQILDKSRYAKHLEKYLKLADRDKILILIYEDALEDANGFLRRVYEFLGVDPGFEASMTHRLVNPSRVPRSVGVDRATNAISARLRRAGLNKPWFMLKKLGVGDLIRAANTGRLATRGTGLEPRTRARLVELFAPEVKELESMIATDLGRWRR